jgi:hypothetical protein
VKDLKVGGSVRLQRGIREQEKVYVGMVRMHGTAQSEWKMLGYIEKTGIALITKVCQRGCTGCDSLSSCAYLMEKAVEL